MENQHFSHQHPLVFNVKQSHESAKVNCSGCGEVVSGPSFSCVECGFYLHKQCGEAPSEMNHPFHHNHSLSLLVTSPSGGGQIMCDFCNRKCENFFYHCSCNLALHIKCALFSYNNISKKQVDHHLQHIAYKDPSIFPEHLSQQLIEAKCFACWKPLVHSPYLSPDCGFSLHRKCSDLPLELNHLFHRQHSLLLQFNRGRLPCKICQKTQPRGLVYCCPICEFVLHIECMLPIIEHTSSREHRFSKLWLRQSSFTCDACGTSGNYDSHICSTCNLIVHEKCISLPRIIKSLWHHHLIFHEYFVVDNERGTLECEICHEEVNKDCGSYYCSDCKFILHVNCALQETSWYYKIESIVDYEKKSVVDTGDPPFSFIKGVKHGETVINTEIKHFSHQHNLELSEVVKDDDRYCDGCSMLITTPFYLCLQCHFSLHKSCAELPRKKEIWIHFHQFHQLPLNLITDSYFNCSCCQSQCSGFAYICMEYLCGKLFCIRCANISLACTSQGHEHLLRFYHKYNGKHCNACGDSTDGFSIYRCKACDFNLHFTCTFLPQTARHKCDEHLLTLKSHEDNDYSKHHFCDVCEGKRNPNTWFYHCEICDTSAHLKCVGDFPFIKLGTSRFFEEHPQRLVLVRKVYDYPECCKSCGKPCLDLALECAETRCNYVIHFENCDE
ncbi:hypothetical protein PTKIN_Ptkin14bG0071400 [Pterospermum kingtungense]